MGHAATPWPRSCSPSFSTPMRSACTRRLAWSGPRGCWARAFPGWSTRWAAWPAICGKPGSNSLPVSTLFHHPLFATWAGQQRRPAATPTRRNYRWRTLFTRPLTEQYRPRNVGRRGRTGQDRIARIQALAKRSAWRAALSGSRGQSGTGKTTIARLIAGGSRGRAVHSGSRRQRAHRGCTARLGARHGRPAAGGEGRPRLLSSTRRTGSRKDVIRQCWSCSSASPPHVVWSSRPRVEGQESLFEDYDDASPLLSRACRLDLARRDLAKPFAERAKADCGAGRLGRQAARALRQADANLPQQLLRGALQAIEAGEMAS